ncbi:MAG: hypothetical protein K0S12_1740, partial [Bacteroidetes bacterium]|nr:hypothetical protein [Bacteroidota bacterium]
VKRCNSVTAYSALFSDLVYLSKSENKTIAKYMKGFMKEELYPAISKKAESDEQFRDLRDQIAATLK